jgi:hypothetical protein
MDNQPAPTAETTRSVPLNLTNSGYIKLVELANYYGIALEDIGNVIIKGLSVLQAVKDAGSDQIIIEGGGQRKSINVREL